MSRHSAGTRFRQRSVPTETMALATTSIGARGGTTVPPAMPPASVIAHPSSRTGGLRSRAGTSVLDRCKGFDLLDGRRTDPGDLLQRIHSFLHKHARYFVAVGGGFDL